MTKRERWVTTIAALIAAFALTMPPVLAQLQQSGGPGSTVTANAGTNLNTSALALDSTVAKDASLTTLDTDIKANITLHAGSAVIGHVIVDTAPTTAVTLATAPSLVTGTANVGFFRMLPSSCSQATPFANTTVGVATSAGTSVSSTTTCVTYAYVNNITNASVTLRLQDKTGTPIIWLGGNADFSIPANSNLRLTIDGVTFTSGMTAIAGTGSALNLQINGVQ